MRLAIKLAAGAVTLGLVFMAALGLFGGMFERSTRGTYAIDRTVREVVLDNSLGSVTIRPPQEGETYGLRSTAAWSLTRPRQSVSTEEGIMRARSECSTRSPADRCRTDWIVIAPPGMHLTITNGVGEIRADGVDNRVTVRGDVGSIRLVAMTSPAIDARTRVGAIEIDATRPPESITARTSVGSIDVAVPRGPVYQVDLMATDSAAQPDVATDPQSEHRIRVAADLGDAKVRYR